MNQIGYYQTVGAYGDFLDSIPEGMEWGHVDMLSPAAIAARGTTQATNEALAVRFAARGMKAAYNVAPLLWIPGWDAVLNQPAYVRHPDWQSRFDYHASRYFDAFAGIGALHSLYLADEPYANNIPVADVLDVATWIGANYSYPTMLVEHYSKRLLTIPAVDFYGVSAYSAIPFHSTWQHVTATPQINVVVAQAFHEVPHVIPDQWKWYALYRAIASRPGATLALFLWPSFVQAGLPRTGTVDDPAVQRAHEAMLAEAWA